ncbi:MAG: phage major capsid protein [Desulfobacteraceae bacterium]|nr:phage major capsid protein [Desulfobacteraceae bacterium]
MNKLKELQTLYKASMERLKQIRKLEGGDLTEEIRLERDGHLELTEALKGKIDKEHLKRHNDNSEHRTDISTGGTDRGGNGYEVRSANQPKDFRSLWGNNPLNRYSWNDQEHGLSFYQAVFSGRHHPALTTRAMTIGLGSGGGFLIPAEYSEKIHNVALENEIVMPLATVVPMRTNDKKLPALDIGDHSSNLFGGFTASYSPEAGTLSDNNPLARAMLLSCKKLYGFLRFSNELFEDLPGGGGKQLTEIMGKGLAWYRDKFFLKGTGAGQPLGVLNAGCVVEIAKESDQLADTIVVENLLKMLSRLYMGSFKNSVWIVHPTCIPEIGTLSYDVGTGGSHIPVMSEKDGQFTILTRPVIFTEKTEPLGDAGDIMLCDFSQYVIGLREEMRIDFSPHLYFSTDEMAARLIERHDGFPLWDTALTLEDGSTTVSPFVRLAERA